MSKLQSPPKKAKLSGKAGNLKVAVRSAFATRRSLDDLDSSGEEVTDPAVRVAVETVCELLGCSSLVSLRAVERGGRWLIVTEKLTVVQKGVVKRSRTPVLSQTYASESAAQADLERVAKLKAFN